MATVAKPTTPTKISVPPIVPRIAPREDLNPFRIAQIQFDMAAEFLKLDPGLRQILRTPKRVLEVSLPTKIDRKSTRLNSSHGYISYAVFCLKKKKRRWLLGGMYEVGSLATDVPASRAQAI